MTGRSGTYSYPRVSPLFGPLNNLPQVYVYSSSRDTLAIDTVRLRDRVLAENLSGFTFRLRKGLLHDWVIYAPLPDAQAERANLYHDLALDVPSFLPDRYAVLRRKIGTPDI